ncbi:TMEM175 family protein [Acidiphilium sp. AL]|uniref:TMEM175 family protein n=1 Tax=Acidiphilium iwatense TaxID=768198 RepID=A0ABS9DR59_9PROT|nr:MULTISPECIES: TMEM175 family protein [Acidiphilium]MCF3945212.1 TMEM175 family protein [Acidiphilium iwatense]MCU4159496.1 TMEM175 family protein [Acidiphilium sp. AL]
MPDRQELSYNRISGQNLDRLAALSDGLFAIAMTLLVFDLHTPVVAAIHDEAGLWRALLRLGPHFATFLMSFLTLGIFWVGQQTGLGMVARCDRHLTWLNLGFLFAISLLPFSTRLIGDFPDYRLALGFYWLNILLGGVMIYASWRYARAARLLKPEITEATACAMERRVLVAQGLYAAGAALCFIDVGFSIAAIILVQMIYVIGPRTGFLARL